VVFFRAQEITTKQQEELGTRLGELSGKPATSKLHIHPLAAEFSENGDYISVIDADFNPISHDADLDDRSLLASRGWHAEYLPPKTTTTPFVRRLTDDSITFEKTPSDYAILKLHTLPETGGDTLWASAYEAYDRLSLAYRAFLEGLTAVYSAQQFKAVAARHGRSVRTDERGAPDNVGGELYAVHLVVRTNPVTGWKGLFVNRGYASLFCQWLVNGRFAKRILEVNEGRI
jgi:alpha-ketoglutarate-dependent taurine dioxygenase